MGKHCFHGVPAGFDCPWCEIERLKAARETYRKAGASLYHLVSLNHGFDLPWEDALLAVDDEAAKIEELKSLAEIGGDDD